MIHRIHQRAKTHYHTHYRAKFEAKAHLVFLIDSILVAAALSVLALGLYFQFFYHPLRDDFRFSVSLEGAPKTGETATAVVRMTNAGERELHDARLTMHFPEAFRPSVFPEGYDRETGLIEIGRLAPDSSAEYRFAGLLLAPPGRFKAYAHLTARDEADDSDEKLASSEMVWQETSIVTEIEAPRMIPNRQARLVVTFKNRTALDFGQLQLVPKWPEGLRVTGATPPVSRGVVNLGRIGAGEEVQAAFSVVSTKTEPARVGFDLVWVEDAATRTTIASVESDLQVIDARLELFATPKAEGPLRPGQSVPIAVTYANRGTLTLKNVRVRIAEQALFTTRTEEGGLSVLIPEIPPGATGEALFEGKVSSDLLDPGAVAKDPSLKPIPRATFDVESPASAGIETGGDGASVKIAGQASLVAAGRYFSAEGDQLGRGPLPPQVGKTTRYWIFASVRNGPTELKDARVTLTLPPHVEWTGRASVSAGEEPVASGSHVLWTLGDLARHAGTDAPAASISLEVALTPPTSQIGTSALLLLDARLAATDAWTELAITDTAPGMTTELPGDPGIRGRGTVKN